MCPTGRLKLKGVNLLFDLFTTLPSDYRTAGCLNSCFFFFCCRHPFHPPFISAHSNSCCAMAAPVPLLKAYQPCADSVRDLMPVRVVTLSHGMENADVRQRWRRPRPSCDWSALLGKSAQRCFKWETRREQIHLCRDCGRICVKSNRVAGPQVVGDCPVLGNTPCLCAMVKWCSNPKPHPTIVFRGPIIPISAPVTVWPLTAVWATYCMFSKWN